MAIVLKHRKTSKNGRATYEIEGVRGSVYVTKQMFGEQGAPESLEINYDGFAAPGSGTVRKSDPERAAKAQEAAKKAVERAEKAAQKAAKAKERAEKLAKAAGAPQPQAEAEAQAAEAEAVDAQAEADEAQS